MALGTVAQYVSAARTLLQDTVVPYRYPDADLVSALNMAVMDARKIRPDLFMGRFSDLPEFSTADSTAVNIDVQYRTAFLYYIVGQAQLRDDEGTQDSRAATFMNKFATGLLTSVA